MNNQGKYIKNGYNCLRNCGNKVGFEGNRCRNCSAKEKFSIPENNPNFRHGKTSHYIKNGYNCLENCGVKVSRRENRCYSCAITHNHKIGILDFNGENNPVWMGGKSFEEYPKEFNEELKLEIRTRDSFECQCGMTEEEHLIVIGQVLHVHHIDYNKHNCNKSNLISTCLWCNVRANTNRSYWVEFYQNKLEERGIIK